MVKITQIAIRTPMPDRGATPAVDWNTMTILEVKLAPCPIR